MAAVFKDVWYNRNILLTALTYASSIPPNYTVVPPLTSCRIFTSALSQRNCGACAAFAASTLLSMQSCLYRNDDFIPSPFRVFDCSNSTCTSGLSITEAAAIVNFGVGDIAMSERVYGLPCDLQAEHHRPKIIVSGLSIRNAQQIKTAILWFGPVIASMNMPDGRCAETGVYFADESLQPDEDGHLHTHAIVVVGWDEDNNWIVQNSWGNRWGDGQGRGRISPDLLLHATDPTVLIVFRVYVGIVYCCLACLAISFLYAKNTPRRSAGENCWSYV